MGDFDHQQSPRLGQPTPVESTSVRMFSGSEIPEAAWRGQIIYRTDTQHLQVFNGTAWEDVVGGVGGLLTFVGPDEPVSGMGEGDLWFDSNDGNRVHWYNGSAWIDIQDTGIPAAQAAAAAAQSDATTALSEVATRVKTFVQDNPPTSEEIGDIWFDSNDGFKQYRAADVGTVSIGPGGWEVVADERIALSVGKNKVFYQTTAPTAEGTGDLWYDTDDGYHLYLWDGTSWVDARDAAIATAESDAAAALTAANGKNKVFYTTTAPTATAVNDLWFDTDDGYHPYVWSGSAWVDARDATIATAQSDATSALGIANGKNKVFFQTSAPTATAAGDIWYDTDDGNKIYEWSGSAWVAAQLGTSAIANDAITASLIAAGAVGTSEIAANAITTGLIAANAVTSTQISDGAVVSPKIAAGAVTTEKLTVATLGSSLVRNGNFEEVSSTDATLPAGWARNTVWGGDNPVLTTSSPITGAQSMSMPCTPTTASHLMSEAFPVVAGQVYVIKCKTKMATPSTHGWYLLLHGGTTPTDLASYIPTDGSVTDVGVPVGVTDWVATLTIPAGMTWAHVGLLNYGPASGVTSTVMVDDVSCQQVIVSGQIADGAITAPKIVAGAVTADKIAAGAVSTEKLTVAGVGDTLILNGNFADVDASNHPQGWAVNDFGYGIASWSGVTAGVDHYMLVTTNSGGGVGIFQGSLNSGRIPVNPGDQFYLEAGACSTPTGASWNPVLYIYDRDGGFLTSVSPADAPYSAPAASGYLPSAGRHGGVVTIPAGAAAYALAALHLNTASTSCYFDKFTVAKVQVSARIADGAITTPKLVAGSVTAAKIATDTITANEIAAGAITASELAANSVIAGKINAGAVTAGTIAANAVTAGAVDSDVITAREIASSTITAAEIASATITANLLSSTLVLASHISVGSNMSLDPSTGLVINLSNGGLISLPSNGSPAQFLKVVLEATQLLVNDNFELRGATNIISGTLKLSTGVDNPATGPTVSSVWPAASVGPVVSNGGNYKGMYDGSTVWWTAEVGGSGPTPYRDIIGIDKSTGAITTVASTATLGLSTHQQIIDYTVLGTNHYVMVGTYGTPSTPPVVPQIYVYNSSWVNTAIWNVPRLGNRNPTLLSNDGTDLFVGWYSNQSFDYSVAIYKITTAGIVTRYNLLTNPSFDSVLTGWVTEGGTITQTSAEAKYGTYSCSAPGSWGNGGIITDPSTPITVSPSTAYTFSIYVKQSTGSSSTHAAILWYDGTGSLITTSTGTSSSSTTSWGRFSVTATSPAGAATARVEIYTGIMTTAATYYYDGALFEASASVGNYFDGSVTDTAGAIDWWNGSNGSSTSNEYTGATLQFTTATIGDLSSTPFTMWVGTADLGAKRFVIGQSSGVFVWDSSGTRQSTQEWAMPGGQAATGYFWDGTNFKALTYTSAGGGSFTSSIFTLSKVTTNTSFAARYSQYDSAGTTHETAWSPASTLTVGARQFLKVQSSAPQGTGGADEPNSIRFYVQTGGAGSYYRQADITAAPWSATYDIINTAGATAVSTPDFSAVGNPGVIQSAKLDANGYPLWQMKGDGTVHMFPGEVRAFAGFNAPLGTLKCDGTSYLRSLYVQLFAAITFTKVTDAASHPSGINTVYIADTSNIALGMQIEGTGIVQGSTVTAISTNFSVTISNNTTAAIAGATMTFLPHGGVDTTHFNVPDYRGRVLVGVDGTTEFAGVGTKYGFKTHTLVNGEMPVHSHGGYVGYVTSDHAHNISSDSAGGAVVGTASARFASGTFNYAPTGSVYNTSVSGITSNHQHGINNDGGGGAHNNIQPSSAVNWIIAW